MRILIVEDEEEILSYLKEELEGDYRIMTGRMAGRLMILFLQILLIW